MRRPQGYGLVTAPDGTVLEEFDTFTCRHCNAIIQVAPGQTDTDSCRLCDAHICQPCALLLVRTMKCSHIERRLEAMERVR